ncbi:hypothetical protein SteCoe_25245 [Stentor coeruleus]|uniref:Arb2 domain-containing protein n=1 Tax=Stentor coeruleus TaxID=5963 RepID=A0A1R2BFU1_9CILI|nr:hypothetical protein SteCoe_25245 [Stentor coeruleus]
MIMDKKVSKNFNDRIKKGWGNRTDMKTAEEEKNEKNEEVKGLRVSGDVKISLINANKQIKESASIYSLNSPSGLTNRIINPLQKLDFLEQTSKTKYYPSNFSVLEGQKQKSKFKSQTPSIELKIPIQEETKLKNPYQIPEENPKNFASKSDYEEFALSLILDVQNTLITKYHLSEIWLPIEEKYSQGPRCNIFISANWSTSYNKKLILIQGAGKVRAGIWSRSVCINESLYTGSMLPFIEAGLEEQYDIMILNPNFIKDPETKNPIPLNSSRTEHGEYVWEKFINNTFGELYLVAHSCGGYSVQNWANTYWQEFKIRVKKIAFIDAVSTVEDLDREKCVFVKKVARHWKASEKPGNEKLNSYNEVCEYSAGHNKHEYTSSYAFPYIFPFFQSL